MNLNPIEKIGMANRITQIQQRISNIETKFAITENNFDVNKISGDFQTKLDAEIQRQDKVSETLKASAENKVADKKSPAENKITNSKPQPVNENFTQNQNSDTESLIKTAAQIAGVDPALVRAVAVAESDMNQNAISPVGAIGVMQLMPETAAALGVDPYDERQNIQGGANYLRQMLDKFNGNVPHALAAYNAGPGAVQKYGGVPPYKETQNYVGRIMDIVTKS